MIKRMLAAVCICAVAVAGAVQTAHAADVSVGDIEAFFSVETVSGGDAASGSGIYDGMTVLDLTDILPLANYNTYYGSIGSTYLEYMRGYLPKLSSAEHYVGARVGQYDYIFAYGEDLKCSGSQFSGSVTVVTWNTYNNGTFSVSYDSNFRLSAGSYLVYTDLPGNYPTLATSSDFTLRQILILFTIMCLCWTIDHMYQVRKIRRVLRRNKF